MYRSPDSHSFPQCTEHVLSPFSQQSAFEFLSSLIPHGTHPSSIPVPRTEGEMQRILSASSHLPIHFSFGYDNERRQYITFLLFVIQDIHERYILTMRGLL